MNYDDYLKVTLNGFLINAGVIGLIRFMEVSKAKINEDYFYEGQNIYISKKFILEHDIAALYVKSIVTVLKSETKFVKVIDKKLLLDSYYASYNPDDKELIKKIDGIYKEFVEMLEKSSFKSGYEILNTYKDIEPIKDSEIRDLKKEKDLLLKKKLYDSIIEKLKQTKVSEVLIFKELMYSKINMFFENISFFLNANLKKDIAECYNKDFVIDLKAMVEGNQKKLKRCIDCNELVSSVRPISFMNDMADDLSRKKSYYWNLKPDANLCPLCTFVYTLVPIGFNYIGRDAVFINNNSDIYTLLTINSTMSQKSEEQLKNEKYGIYNLFTEQKIERLKERVNNIQVIIREKDESKYKFNILDKNKISLLNDLNKQLTFIKKIYRKSGKDYINVYQSVVENIVDNRAQYNFINKLLRLALEDNSNIIYISKILEIQVSQRRNEVLKENFNQIYAAKMCGQEMRNFMTGGLAEKDKDNKLRGYIYQLLNALSVGNKEQFMNMIIRSYSSLSKPIPNIFINCFSSDEEFKEIGYSYILGLKSEKYQKEGVNNDEE